MASEHRQHWEAPLEKSPPPLRLLTWKRAAGALAMLGAFILLLILVDASGLGVRP